MGRSWNESASTAGEEVTGMKILHVIDSLSRGGAEILLQQICAGQIRAGLEPSVYVCRRTPGKLETDFLDVGCHVYQSGIGNLNSPLQVIALARHLRQNPYHLVHVHLFPAQLWAAMAAALLPSFPPLITTEHSTWNRRRRSPLGPFDRLMYRRYRALICITDAVRESLWTWVQPDAPEIAVVVNGIDLLRVAVPNRSISEVEQHVLTIGSLCERKDHATLLRAIACVDGARLVLVGKGELDRK